MNSRLLSGLEVLNQQRDNVYNTVVTPLALKNGMSAEKLWYR